MVVEGLHVQIGAEPLPALQLLLGPGPADGHGLSRPCLPGCWGEDVGNSIAQRLKLIWSHLFTFDATAVRPFKYLTPSPLADGMCSHMGALSIFSPSGPVFKPRMTLAEIIPPALTPSLRIMIGVQTAQDHLAASRRDVVSLKLDVVGC